MSHRTVKSKLMSLDQICVRSLDLSTVMSGTNLMTASNDRASSVQRSGEIRLDVPFGGNRLGKESEENAVE